MCTITHRIPCSTIPLFGDWCMQHFFISHTNSYIFFLFIDNAICSYPQQGGSITNVNLAMACNGVSLVD